MLTSLYCDAVLREGRTCGLRPLHRGQHRSKDTLTYCDNCNRPIHVASAVRRSVGYETDDYLTYCWMCVNLRD